MNEPEIAKAIDMAIHERDAGVVASVLLALAEGRCICSDCGYCERLRYPDDCSCSAWGYEEAQASVGEWNQPCRSL